jgi:hypothetical protein
MPVGARPSGYGITDRAMPEGLMAQMVYPLLQDDPRGVTSAAAEPAT